MKGLSTDELHSQVRSFLRDFKELIGQGRYYVKEHHKTMQTLIDLGFTFRQMDEVILSIELEEYASGPTPDQFISGDYWVFGKHLEEVEIYIKLKIVSRRGGEDKAICISFHQAEYPMKYPLRRMS